MKIHIPNSAFLGNIDTFLASYDAKECEKLIITANKKWFSVHPVVLTMVAALGLSVEKNNVHCEKLESKSRHYLERMGLFKLLGLDYPQAITKHESSGRFIPITQVKSSGELSAFIKEMIPLLHVSPKQTESIHYIISELARNVLEHSGSSIGAILCAQYYKKSNMIRIGISDNGVGLLKTIKESHVIKSELQAVQLALTPGISGTTRKEGGTDYNAGAGLFFTKSIAKVNRDFFMIYSGNTMYKLLKRGEKSKPRLYANPFDDKHSSRSDLPYWNGVNIGVDISLDNTQEFHTLLEQIRTTYTKSVRERKKQKYKKPRFI